MAESEQELELKDERTYYMGTLRFIRRSDDSVVVVSLDGRVGLLFEANEWASVVASMSAHGETARSFSLAERFHKGRWTEARPKRGSVSHDDT